MNLFAGLLLKILTLYLIILAGFIAGRFLKVPKESLSKLLIYIFAPVIVFQGLVSINLQKGTLVLPLVFFAISCVTAFVFLFFGGLVWKDETKNILAFASSSGNTSFFGLPVVLALLGPSYISFAVLCTIGTILFQNSIGFYLVARGQHTARQSARKLAELPAIYAFLIGIAVNLLHIKFGQTYNELVSNFQGGYVVLGMMMAGVGIGEMKTFSFDWAFNILVFLAKFIFWPACALGIIFFDRSVSHFIPTQAYEVILLLSAVPVAANTVAYAAELKAHPVKAAMAVMFTTFCAIFFLPLFALLFIK